MKKLLSILLLLMLLGFSPACSAFSSHENSTVMIEPGDKVGNFLISKGVEGQFTYGFRIDCSESVEQNIYACNVNTDETINVSTGIVDSSGNGNLDEIWAKSNYQMLINGRPVDLPAFGTIDYTHLQVGVIRFANVVISSYKSGQITVGDSGVYDNGGPFLSTSTYVDSNP